ncbi:zinc-binding dehydrogenase [Ancylobacter sp. VNQ12]|uniref:zinc-binding dehydrogenase n=1 Tax=Ancylobacter sp. VNQ12 TaxID=3400920 RepID=UPI003C06DAA1
MLPKWSRAAVLREYKVPLAIEEVQVPQEIEPGALLTKIDTCTVCGTDVHLWQGSLTRKVDLPVIIGHEMLGRVIGIGSGAERDSLGAPLRIGDRITWTRTHCGSCYFCTAARQPILCENARAYMYENVERYPYLLGGFSEYGYVLPEAGRVKVPDDVSNELASLSSCAFRSVMNAFDELGTIATTDTVLIQGCGPLGLLAVAVAKVSGARRVIVIGAPEARLALASEFGADVILSVEGTTAEERRAAVLDVSSGRGADIVMEFAGQPSAFLEGLQLARRGGRYVTVGLLGSGQMTFQPSIITTKNLRIIGSLGGEAKAYWKALDFIAAHQSHIPFHRILSNTYQLDEVNIALERMRLQQEVKPIIQIAG